MVELKVEIKVPDRETLAFLWSHSSLLSQVQQGRHTLRALPPEHPESYFSWTSLLPLGPIPLPSLPGLLQQVPNWSPCLDPCSLLSLFYTAAKVILSIGWLIQTPLMVSQLTWSQKQICETASKTLPSWPLLPSFSLIPSPALAHILPLPRFTGLFAVPTYAEQAPASECFQDLCLENSSLDIKALLSFCLQFPAQVSPYQRSLPHHAL